MDRPLDRLHQCTLIALKSVYINLHKWLIKSVYINLHEWPWRVFTSIYINGSEERLNQSTLMSQKSVYIHLHGWPWRAFTSLYIEVPEDSLHKSTWMAQKIVYINLHGWPWRQFTWMVLKMFFLIIKPAEVLTTMSQGRYLLGLNPSRRKDGGWGV